MRNFQSAAIIHNSATRTATLPTQRVVIEPGNITHPFTRQLTQPTSAPGGILPGFLPQQSPPPSAQHASQADTTTHPTKASLPTAGLFESSAPIASGGYTSDLIPRNNTKCTYLLIRHAHETRPESFKPCNIHKLRTLWHFLHVWDHLPTDSHHHIFSRIHLFYIIAMRGWNIVVCHATDPDATTLFGPLPDSILRIINSLLAATNTHARRRLPT